MRLTVIQSAKKKLSYAVLITILALPTAGFARDEYDIEAGEEHVGTYDLGGGDGYIASKCAPSYFFYGLLGTLAITGGLIYLFSAGLQLHNSNAHN